jgi:hypothetical protein
MYIYGFPRELREERALRNWRRHSILWQKLERELSKNVQKVIHLCSKFYAYSSIPIEIKSQEDLLMARLGEHRERMEERDLIEEAMQLLEQRQMNFWSSGLKIGNDLVGLMLLNMPQGGTRR